VSLFLVIVGAAVGAPLRYLSDRAIQTRHDSVFPWGTFAVNVGGASPQIQLALGTGLCGALTTYSTFSYETLRLLEDDSRLFAAANIVASIVAGLGAAFLGVATGQAIWS
jgi:CrcB protein